MKVLFTGCTFDENKLNELKENVIFDKIKLINFKQI